MQEWFKTYYGPNNTTLVIAGDITPEVARQKVEKYYGEIPRRPAHRQAGSMDRQAHRHAPRLGAGPRSAGAPVSHLERAAFGSPEEALLDLAAQVLGRGKTSRLYKRLVYKDQTATSATAS